MGINGGYITDTYIGLGTVCMFRNKYIKLFNYREKNITHQISQVYVIDLIKTNSISLVVSGGVRPTLCIINGVQ